MNDILNVDNVKLSFDPKATKFIEYNGIVRCILPGRVLGRSVSGIGTARYKSGDKPDIELARKIAMAKAENNAYRKVRNLITDYLNEVWDKLRPYADFLDKADAVIEHNEDYLKNLTHDRVNI